MARWRARGCARLQEGGAYKTPGDRGQSKHSSGTSNPITTTTTTFLQRPPPHHEPRRPSLKKARAAEKTLSEPAVRMAMPSGVSITSFCSVGGGGGVCTGRLSPRPPPTCARPGSPPHQPRPLNTPAAPAWRARAFPLRKGPHLHRTTDVRKLQAFKAAHELLELRGRGHRDAPAAFLEGLAQGAERLHVPPCAHACQNYAPGAHGAGFLGAPGGKRTVQGRGRGGCSATAVL